MWNVQSYLYDLRVLRYIFFGAAIIFMAIYWVSSAILIDLMFVKGRHAGDKKLSWFGSKGKDRAPDLLFALFVGYNLVEFMPTAFSASFYIIKELTMKQSAFSADEDWSPGMLFGIYGVNLFDWLGIDGDPAKYKEWLMDWTHEFH